MCLLEKQQTHRWRMSQSLGDSMDTEILKFTVPAIIAILGWFVAHQFNTNRDNKNKRRDIRIRYLLDAYRRLEGASNRPEADKETQDRFESALADIQLLGNKEQIDSLTWIPMEVCRHDILVDYDPPRCHIMS
jgi:hypothetical protein